MYHVYSRGLCHTDNNRPSPPHQDTLKHPPPYPTIVLPPNGGWWLETPDAGVDDVDDVDVDIEVDDTSRIYRAHFLGYEHYNFYGTDEQGRML